MVVPCDFIPSLAIWIGRAGYATAALLDKSPFFFIPESGKVDRKDTKMKVAGILLAAFLGVASAADIVRIKLNIKDEGTTALYVELDELARVHRTYTTISTLSRAHPDTSLTKASTQVMRQRRSAHPSKRKASTARPLAIPTDATSFERLSLLKTTM